MSTHFNHFHKTIYAMLDNNIIDIPNINLHLGQYQ